MCIVEDKFVPPTPKVPRKPLTPTQLGWIGAMLLGLVLAVIGFVADFSQSGSGVTLSDIVFGGLAATGGALIAVGAIMLFHPPERKPR
jgi:hypothetical protein